MNSILTTILKDTFTSSKLKHRIRILKSYLLNAFFGGEKITFERQDLDFLASLPEEFIKNFNKDNVYKLIGDLQKTAEALPTLTIYLPIEASDNVALQVCSYSRKTFQNPNLLLDTKFDPSLIGGAALVWKGVFKDYSLKSQIDAKKEDVLAGFKKFLK